MKIKKQLIIQTLWSLPIILFLLLISLYPIFWVIISSFKEVPGGIGFPTTWVFDGYKTIFTKLNIGKYFFNSTLVTFVSVILSTAFITMASYVTARIKFKGKIFVTFMFASTLFIPQYAISFPIYRLINIVGLYDTKTGLILVYLGLNIAVSFFIICGYFKTIPKEMEEAARIDGCGYFGTFWRIMVPLAMPGIMTALILSFLSNWNEFFFAKLLLLSKDNLTIPALLGQFTTKYSKDLNGMFSAIVVSVVPTIIVYLIFSKQFIKSLSDGAVKG